MPEPLLLQEIRRQAAGNLPLQRALVAGAVMEGGSLEGPWPRDDSGCAAGPYQIRYWKNPCDIGNAWQGHPMTAADAEDPHAAVQYAINGLNYRGNALIYADPIDVAFRSERPAHYYSEDQQRRAHEAIAQVFQGEQPVAQIPMPGITWEPAHPDNYRVGRGGVRFEGICLHITDGGKPGGWFAMSLAQRRAAFAAQGRDPNLAGVGATHYSVSRVDEDVAQHVSLGNEPFAQGLIQGRGWSDELVVANPGLSPSTYLISIEHAARKGEKFTDVQWRRSVHLSSWLWQTEVQPHVAITGATLDRRCIKQHSDIDSVDRAFCAGLTEAEMARYIEDMRVMMAGPVEPPPPPVDPRDTRIQELLNAITVQATDLSARADLLEGQAAAARVQAENLRALIH